MNTAAPVALSVRNIHKSFGDHHVLKGISLDAHEGDVISILGASGSGKSTFLRCLNLLETPDDGSVALAGEELKMKRARDGKLHPGDRRQVDRIRSQLGMVFQNFNLWSHMTVLDNLVEGRCACRSAVARKRSRKPRRCSRASASRTSAATIRPICRAASSSGSRSRGRSRCIRR